MRCLDAVAREQAALDLETEVLVLDNARPPGPAGASPRPPFDHRADPPREPAPGKVENDTALSSAHARRFCVLLNEDLSCNLAPLLP